MTRHASADNGSTLVELLIVAAVLGILAAIAIPVFLMQRAGSVESGMRADLRATAGLMEAFYVDNRRYAADVDELALAMELDDGLWLSGKNKLEVEMVEGAHYCLRAENPDVVAVLRYDNVVGGLRAVDEACA